MCPPQLVHGLPCCTLPVPAVGSVNRAVVAAGWPLLVVVLRSSFTAGA